MTPQEGILFLLRRARLLKRKATPDSLTTSALQDASTLVHLMDGFPLALDQAGAYIDETGCDLAHYRTLYQMNCGLLLARRGQNSQDYPGSVLVTLSASIQQVEGRSLAAANLLRLCAFLSPEAIPEEIFLQEKRACSSATPSLTFDALELDEALAHLRCYSLITRDAGTRMLSIHRMVQAAIQTCMDQSTFHYWIQQAIQTVNSAFPAVEALTTWAQCQRLLSPALACARWIEEEQIVSETAGRLLHQTGAYLLECALYAQAEIYITQAQAIREQLLGPEHPDVAESLNYIAELAYHKGQYRQAEQLHLQALHIRQRYLGTRHPDVATSLHNLAGVCWAQGRYAQAESLYRQTLQIREATLGLDHLDVGETLQNLAYLLYEQKRYSEAEPLYQRALIICQQVLSPKHVYLTTIFSNLGRLYQAVGRNTEAKTFYRQAKALWDQGRDPNHPYHALILHNLAGLACTEGELIEAETLYQEALQIRESTLGPDHPRTAQSLHDLATFYMKQNLDTQAMRLYQQALAIREKTLGSDHPDTAKTRQCHTQLLAQMGQMDKQTLQGCPGE